MAKAAVTRSIRDDHQKNFLKIFNGLTGKHSRWEIWEDFVTLTAIEISNSTDKVNDFIVGLMCYIQCSFMGCAGYVVIGDTLVNPATAYDSRGLLPAGPQNRIWYMPLFSTDVWYMRRQIAQMNLLFEPKGEPAKIEKSDIKPANLQKSIKNEPKAPENEPLNETKTGQLTFF